jgi:ribulose-phosphate 3-epimerase
VAHVLDLVDLVLVMTVNPGFGGQDYIVSMEPKVAEVRRLIDRRQPDDGRDGRPNRASDRLPAGESDGDSDEPDAPDGVRDESDTRYAERGGATRPIDLEVDGGIGPETVAGAVSAGANVLVTGSALFRDPDGLEHAVSEIRKRAESAPPP